MAPINLQVTFYLPVSLTFMKVHPVLDIVDIFFNHHDVWAKKYIYRMKRIEDQNSYCVRKIRRKCLKTFRRINCLLKNPYHTPTCQNRGKSVV